MHTTNANPATGDGGARQAICSDNGRPAANSLSRNRNQAGDEAIRIEIAYTRDRCVECVDGSWFSHPHPPDNGGWLIWDTNPERKTGWLRVITDRPRTICLEGGRA